MKVSKYLCMYKNMYECAKAIKLSGAEIVTVAVRRVNITDKKNHY